MAQNLIKESTTLENLEQFRFNLGNEAHSLFDILSKKETINDQSLSEFVAEESIKQLSARMIETNDQVKKLQESMNSLLMQQIQLQKQLIDQVAKNSCMLERVLSVSFIASSHLETPASQPIVCTDNANEILQETAISRGKSRLTFSQQPSALVKEEIKKESDLFEDFII